MKKLLFWLPRILTILYACFLSLFALDVFGHYGFWQTILALLIHLIPVWIILIALIVSWRWEWVGGVVYTALGVWYIVMTKGKAGLLTYAIMSGPLFLIGILFTAGWLTKKGAGR